MENQEMDKCHEDVLTVANLDMLNPLFMAVK